MKPLNALACLGTAAHHGFERWAGVGVFLEPWLGRRRTNALWAAQLSGWLAQALRPSPRTEPLLAFNAGVAVAGAIVHFVDWPWTARFGVVPWLDEAEGLPPERLDAYNSVLWAWLLAGLGSAALETAPGHRRYFAAGLATGPLLLASARHHFEWAREQAKRDPENWSAAL